LKRTEHVHHVDENPANNALSNLIVMTHGDHRSLHHHLDPEWAAANFAKGRAANRTARWTPEARRIQSERMTQRMNARWRDAGFRKARSEAVTRWLKIRWQDPAYRQQQSKWAKGRRASVQSPRFIASSR